MGSKEELEKVATSDVADDEPVDLLHDEDEEDWPTDVDRYDESSRI